MQTDAERVSNNDTPSREEKHLCDICQVLGFAASWTMGFGVTRRCGPCPHAEPARLGLTPDAMQDMLRSQS